MFITLSFRKNLIYLFLLFIFILLRRILAIILSSIYGLDNSLIFCLLMFLGEFIAGLIIYHKQSSFLDKNLNERKIEHQLSKQKIEMKRAVNIHNIDDVIVVVEHNLKVEVTDNLAIFGIKL